MNVQTANHFKTFTTILIGQMASSFGSGLTQFALVLTAMKLTGSMTQFSLTFLCMYLPALLFSPWAGTLVDRKDRKQILYWSNGVAFSVTLVLILILLFVELQLWHIYMVILIKAIASTFQLTVTQTLVTVLVPKEHHGRANGMQQMAEALPRILAPLLGAMLLSLIGLKGIIWFELFSYLIAFTTLIIAKIPKNANLPSSRPSVIKEAWEGWKYIVERKSLIALLIYLALNNFLLGIVEVLVLPMVKGLVGEVDYEMQAGILMFCGGIGMMIGSLAMVFWGGPKRKIHGVLGCILLGGLILIPGGIVRSIELFYIGTLIYFITIPISMGSNQTIWQSKVPLHLQGRVFSLRRMCMLSAIPLATLVAGPLADFIGPLLLDGGALASSVGLITGVGEGRGVAFLFMMMGVFSVLLALLGYLTPQIRKIETLLPDMVGDKRSVQADSVSGQAKGNPSASGA